MREYLGRKQSPMYHRRRFQSVQHLRRRNYVRSLRQMEKFLQNCLLHPSQIHWLRKFHKSVNSGSKQFNKRTTANARKVRIPRGCLLQKNQSNPRTLWLLWWCIRLPPRYESLFFLHCDAPNSSIFSNRWVEISSAVSHAVLQPHRTQRSLTLQGALVGE